MRALSLTCALFLITTSVARAQDPATVDGAHYRLLIDNARTRVFHVLVGPGEKVPMHEHPDAIAVPLGSRAGGAYFVPAQKHAGDNPGKAPVDFIYIELKGDAAPTAAVPASRPGLTSARLVEHAKADAIRATADTGFSEPAGTTHDYDQVIVALGDGEFSLTVDGKTRNRWKPGGRGLHRPPCPTRIEERRQTGGLRDRRDQVIVERKRGAS